LVEEFLVCHPGVGHSWISLKVEHSKENPTVAFSVYPVSPAEKASIPTTLRDVTVHREELGGGGIVLAGHSSYGQDHRHNHQYWGEGKPHQSRDHRKLRRVDCNTTMLRRCAQTNYREKRSSDQCHPSTQSCVHGSTGS